MRNKSERGIPPPESRQEKEVRPNSKVGLSLSLCVSDILRGKVREEEVKEIIAGTMASTPEDIDRIIKEYGRTYWHDNREEGEAIARRLFEAGKVKQPRTKGSTPHSASGLWLDAEEAEEEYEKRVAEY